MSKSLFTTIIEEVAPTTETVGVVGQLYLDSAEKKLYQCVSITTETVDEVEVITYEWKEIVKNNMYLHTVTATSNYSGKWNSDTVNRYTSSNVTFRFYLDNDTPISNINTILSLLPNSGIYPANGSIVINGEYADGFNNNIHIIYGARKYSESSIYVNINSISFNTIEIDGQKLLGTFKGNSTNGTTISSFNSITDTITKI